MPSWIRSEVTSEPPEPPVGPWPPEPPPEPPLGGPVPPSPEDSEEPEPEQAGMRQHPSANASQPRRAPLRPFPPIMFEHVKAL